MIVATMHQSVDCVYFILGLSLPLALSIFYLLRRASPLWPRATAVTAGLAAAAASASALAFIHPIDAAIVDLSLHFLGVSVVVAASLFVAPAALAPPEA